MTTPRKYRAMQGLVFVVGLACLGAGCPPTMTGDDMSDEGTDDPTDGATDGTDATDSGTTDTGAPVLAGGCTLDPALPDDAEQLRVTADGVLWLLSDREVYRYEATDDGSACTLEGERVWTDEDFGAVNDIDVDDAGNAWLLVFFDRLVKISPDGKTVLLDCDDGVSGHSIAVNEDGSRVWTVTVGTGDGARLLQWTDISGDVCAPEKEGIKLANSISIHPSYDDGELVVDYFDSSGTLDPGVVIDPSTGTELRQIGTGEVQKREMSSISDIAPTGDGYFVAGSPDGDLWFVDAAGAVQSVRVAEDFLSGPPGQTRSISSIAYSETGSSYIAAGFLDYYGVWRIDL